MSVGDREHVDQRAFDEPEALGPDTVPEVPDVDRDVRDENRRKPDRAPAADARRATQYENADGALVTQFQRNRLRATEDKEPGAEVDHCHGSAEHEYSLQHTDLGHGPAPKLLKLDVAAVEPAQRPGQGHDARDHSGHHRG